jgi:hypothetical protein
VGFGGAPDSEIVKTYFRRWQFVFALPVWFHGFMITVFCIVTTVLLPGEAPRDKVIPGPGGR